MSLTRTHEYASAGSVTVADNAIFSSKASKRRRRFITSLEAQRDRRQAREHSWPRQPMLRGYGKNQMWAWRVARWAGLRSVSRSERATPNTESAEWLLGEVRGRRASRRLHAGCDNLAHKSGRCAKTR